MCVRWLQVHKYAWLETSMAAWASILMFSILAYLAERNWSIVAVAQADDELDEIQQLAERARLSREDQVSQTRDLFDRVKSFKSEVKSVTKKKSGYYSSFSTTNYHRILKLATKE